MIKVCIVGIGGRMGHALWDCCLGTDGAKVVSCIDKNTDTLPNGCNVEVVDVPQKLSSAPDLFIDSQRSMAAAWYWVLPVLIMSSAIRLRNTQR